MVIGIGSMIEYLNFNANSKKKKTTDCVVRALTLATHKPYIEVLDELVCVSKKTGYHINDKKCYERYLSENGFIKFKQPKKKDGTKYTIGEIDKLIDDRTAVISCAHHLTIVKYKKLYDTWDCRNKSVGNYWVKLL